ncbi:two-component sensor histidine kinase [Kineosporia sp. NBRC 101677]|uniref:sensor histidine kinase n=1 Tax=Kineosporia sp. NBRC 101677 TaxID=3032197 RepID=UPI0024A37E0E|nr:HAMP domain-containing sensor histidine kinase [Kineosporia sp. NBRC 101677]GLY15674.1 two-component sensor histidine kinase [Kineosporia sp. NBRC 101677]
MLFAVLLLVLRYVPDANLTVVSNGDFAPRRRDLLKVAIQFSFWGLLFLTTVGLGAGWILAGQMLRPLARITRAAEAAAQGSLSHRVHLPGRDDELRQLADTFDAMLARLERTFEEQRRFTANASHELRTPQTVMKTMLQVARANPEAVDLEQLLIRLQEMNDRSIDTHEALLQLARPEKGDLPREACNLTEVTMDVLTQSEVPLAEAGIELSESFAPAAVHANPPLLRRLVDNLVRNAITHNLPSGGTIWVEVGTDPAGRARLSIANTGARISAEIAATLTEPFVRAHGRTRPTRGPGGSGLGLAIVASVARAHHADLHLTPRPEGGLTVTVTFPS